MILTVLYRYCLVLSCFIYSLLFTGTHQYLVNGFSEPFQIQLLGISYSVCDGHPVFVVQYRYSSRLAYAHTIAVMSMVGYVLGLGDRHGENILFDSTNGDCVHVDFNCLFNRVECLLANGVCMYVCIRLLFTL